MNWSQGEIGGGAENDIKDRTNAMKRNSNLTSNHSVKDISLFTKNERENNDKQKE